MNLTLKDAAERAKIPLDELLRSIENNELIATRASQDAQYFVTLEDLEAFLKKKSFDAFWNNTSAFDNSTDEAQNVAVDSSPPVQSRNLRRVLTAEVVTELKIEHQVLMSRVETLERLFSEFMELEKAEKALVLEDSWKINPSVSKEKSETVTQGKAQSFDQKHGSDQKTHNDYTSEPLLAEKAQVLAEKAQENKIPEFSDELKVANSEETKLRNSGPEVVKEDHSLLPSLPEKNNQGELSQLLEREELGAGQPASAKPRSVKDLLTRKMMEASAEMRVAEKSPETANKVTQENVDLDSPIAKKLEKYERRLIEAKQTATQIWH